VTIWLPFLQFSIYWLFFILCNCRSSGSWALS
ncbi:putative exported domain protein, partial [Chlamydia psittaci 06-1683]